MIYRAIQRSKVVFPAPFGPMILTRSPCVNAERHSFKDVFAVNLILQIVNVQYVCCHGSPEFVVKFVDEIFYIMFRQ